MLSVFKKYQEKQCGSINKWTRSIGMLYKVRKLLGGLLMKSLYVTLLHRKIVGFYAE
jgi:hypothetical protein